MEVDFKRFLLAGFDGYLPKPITPETFLNEIECFLRIDLRNAVASAHTPRPSKPL